MQTIHNQFNYFFLKDSNPVVCKFLSANIKPLIALISVIAVIILIVRKNSGISDTDHSSFTPKNELEINTPRKLEVEIEHPAKTVKRIWVESLAREILQEEAEETISLYARKDIQIPQYPQGSHFIQSRITDVHTPIKNQIRGKVTSVPEEKQPIMYLLMGLPGAGKSFFITHAKKEILEGNGHDSVVIGRDQVMEKMPEYERAINYGTNEKDEIVTGKDAWSMTQQEAGAITADLRLELIAKRVNFIYDAVGSNFPIYNKLINEAQNAKYKIRILYIDVAVETACQRAKARAQINGRWIEPTTIKAQEQATKENFIKFALRPYIESAEMWNNEEKVAHLACKISQGTLKPSEQNYLKTQGFL